MGWFSSKCDICGNPLPKRPMTWDWQGRKATVCSPCNEKLKREASKQAFENRQPANPTGRFGCLGLLGVGALVCMIAAVVYSRTPHNPAPVAPASPAMSPTASPVPTLSAPANPQQRALAKFPALGIKDSSLNRRFVAEYQRLKAANDPLLNNPEWPTALAARCQAALNAEDRANHR